MVAGELNDDLVGNSTWERGDWNNDGEFDWDDLNLAIGLGGYEDPTAVFPDLASFDVSGDGQVDSVDQMLATQGVSSLLGAKVHIESDGSFTYDPTTSEELAKLGDGEYLIDEFVYLVTDATGHRVAVVRYDIGRR